MANGQLSTKVHVTAQPATVRVGQRVFHNAEDLWDHLQELAGDPPEWEWGRAPPEPLEKLEHEWEAQAKAERAEAKRKLSTLTIDL